MQLDKIHSDNRGNINLITQDLDTFQEITIFKTKANFARGGCIHQLSNEYCCVIEGNVAYFVGDKVYNKTVGETIFIPANTPHYFISLTNSIVAEWGATPEEKKCKHKEYRDVVDKINSGLQ